MKAHVYQRRSNVWAVVVEVGKDENGRRKQKWHTVKGTKRQADAKAVELAHKVETGQYVEPTKITAASWLDEWLTQYVAISVRPTTAQSYRDAVTFWKRYLGDVPLAKLTPLGIQNAVNEAVKGYSTSTVRLRLTILHKALKDAVGAELIYRNPADGTRGPREQKKSVRVTDSEGLLRILEAAKDTPWFVPTYLAAATALRRGEVLALTWDQLDWENRWLRVQSSYGGTGTGDAKTKDSRRPVLLDGSTVAVLRAEHKQQAKYKLAFGKGYHDHDLVCATERGEHLSPSGLSKGFRAIALSVGIDLNFHGLRHTHASLLAAAGVHSKAIADRLGHSNQDFTLNHYVSALPTMQQEAVRVLNGLLPAVGGG